MKKEAPIGKRKPSLLSRVTLVLVTFLFIIECAVIAGILEVQAATVARYAPWAYEPFLRLIGEHPSSPVWIEATVEEGIVPPQNASGLDPEVSPVLFTNAQERVQTEPELESAGETNTPPPQKIEEDMPKG